MNERDLAAAPRRAPTSQLEYSAQVQAVAGALRLAHDLLETVDLEVLQRMVQHADAVGPILHPSEWRAAGARGQLRLQEALFRWAAETRRAFGECRRIHEGRPEAREREPYGQRGARS